MEENWVLVENTKGRYYISNLGNVKSVWLEGQSKFCRIKPHTFRILKLCVDKHTGYKTINILFEDKRRTTKIHSLVAKYFVFKENETKRYINHINGIKTDNRAENLEWITNRENVSHGKKFKKDKTSQYTGVSFQTSRNKWVASIQLQGKSYSLGRYNTEDEAYAAYKEVLAKNGLENKYA